MKTKLKNWIQEHKKEIGLVTIGGVAGISTVILGRKFYENVILTKEAPIDIGYNETNNTIGFFSYRKNIFGKLIPKEHIYWKPEDARDVGHGFFKAIDDLNQSKK